jgi:hypothetical protein
VGKPCEGLRGGSYGRRNGEEGNRDGNCGLEEAFCVWRREEIWCATGRMTTVQKLVSNRKVALVSIMEYIG